MKHLFISIITLVVAYACATATAFAATPDATKILDKTAAKINIGRGVKMNFTVSGAKFSQKGTLTVKGQKFHANTANAKIWYDGKTQWTYNKASDEVNIASPSVSVQHQMNPYHFLNLYKQKGYTKTLNSEASKYTIHLTGKGKSISEMYIVVDKNYNLKQVRFKQSGKWTTISVSNIRNTTVPDSYFRFNSKEYPKAEIIDLR